MIWKKSSSIVKWILIISILELVLPHLLYLLPSTREGLALYTGGGISKYFIGLNVLQYSIVLYFIFQFYKRYKEITVLDNAKNLMRKIIKTRKTVKHYVIFSLAMILATCVFTALGIWFNEDFFLNFPVDEADTEKLSLEQLKIVLTIGMIIMGVVLVLLIGAIYFLLYGLLLRKLKKNYKDLKHLEV